MEKDKKKERNKTVELLEEPEKPLPDDCCGNGCDRCVWDVYYEQLEEYKRQ
jgi:transposase